MSLKEICNSKEQRASEVEGTDNISCDTYMKTRYIWSVDDQTDGQRARGRDYYCRGDNKTLGTIGTASY